MDAAMVTDGSRTETALDRLDRIAAIAGRTLGCSAVAIRAGDGEPVIGGQFGLSIERRPVSEVSALEALWCRIREAEEPLVIENAADDPELGGGDAVAVLGIGGCIGLPLAVVGHLVGALWLIVDHPRRWTDAEIRFAEDLAGLAAADIWCELAGEQVEGRLHLQARWAVIEALLGDGEEEKAMSALVEGLCRSLDWQAGSAWFSQADRTTLVCGGVWFSGSIGLDGFNQLYRTLRQEIDEDVLGMVWAQQEPLLSAELDTLTGFGRAAAARSAGFSSGLWLPVASRSRPLGVIELLAQERHGEDGELPLVAASLGRQIGDLLALRAVTRDARIRWPRLARQLGTPRS
jgi:signal transduction protein with GAF and PtsI domain